MTNSRLTNIPVHTLPDGRRVVSSIEISLALGIRHDNFRRSCHRAMEQWPLFAGSFAPGSYYDASNRRQAQYWLGTAALTALCGVMVGKSGGRFRSEVGHWQAQLERGACEMPVVRISVPVRPKPSAPVLAAPTAVSGETLEFISWLMREYGRSVGAEAGYAG